MEHPLLLAFDTSTELASVAVGRGSEILSRVFLPASGGHATRLLPGIVEALEGAGVERTELDGVVVGRGPGSFTGLRISASTARGLGHGLDRPVWPRSSLAAAAMSLGTSLPLGIPEDPHLRGPEGGGTDGAHRVDAEPAEDRPRYVLFDARGDRVYAACYRTGEGGLETLVPPHASTLGEVLASELPSGAFFCGGGALRHRGRLEAEGHPLLAFPAGLPTAEGLLRLHARLPPKPPQGPRSRWEPEYLRGSSAVPARSLPDAGPG